MKTAKKRNYKNRTDSDKATLKLLLENKEFIQSIASNVDKILVKLLTHFHELIKESTK